MDLQRILLVEDEDDIRKIARMSLERIGNFEVEDCSSGTDALDRVAQFRPDLVLLDVMMPGLDGPSTLAELRKIPTLAEVPVVFMTAKVQPQEQKHYSDLGALGVIPKPFDPLLLPETLRKLWSAQVLVG